MKNKILKLCRRLNSFTLDELSVILETDNNIVEDYLSEFVDQKQLVYRNGSYLYIQDCQKKKSIELPFMFQFHSPETIELIIKCFCADIEVLKVINILEPKKNCINKFFKFFREILYKVQYEKLLAHFASNPKIGRSREYFDRTVYLYLYNDNIYVSEKLLINKKAVDYSSDERLLIKNLYLRSLRKVQNKAYAKLFHLHLTEMIWRVNKDYKTLLEDLKNLLTA